MTRRAQLLDRIEAVSVVRGLRGSSSAWLAVWVFSKGYRYLKAKSAPEPVVVREVLRPGEQLVVTHFAPGDEPEPLAPTKRRRRNRG